ncbi:hypothetical protein [Roseimicrobium sp. ORNL1]|uniref:hypothetical protein n=1 Tax=Roseimicrobium sp. ORNL1 TaxID=2711231 RepID=UPI0013E1208B|nr:hypothetical protein [Roseimicrobium sp. ORNL1]QIF00292.1 hypothetical protein G5S37_01715 [Roseimicrobium sp. ORNL1]
MKAESDSIRRLHVLCTALVTGGLALLLGACASSSSSSSVAYSEGYIGGRTASGAVPSTSPQKSKALESRPGLGTTLGSEYTDNSVATMFYRRSQSTPDAVGSFYYNDEEGAKAMSEFLGDSSKHTGSFKLAGGRVRALLDTGWYGGKLPWYESNGKIFVIGEAGRSYFIVLENPGKEKVEVVVSVDGLDTLSGTPASASRRGYVIPPKSEIRIDGMKYNGKMRRFEFGSVRDSQAAKSGGEKGARNVGVIGVAVYVEDEAAAKMARIKEGMTRDDARAFPGS